MRIVISLMLATACAVASAASPEAPEACRVHDPELQGEYVGPCVDGVAHGEGVAKGIARYRGMFAGGRKHGAGLKEWSNGDRYEGEFVADRRQGFGSYVWGRGSDWAGQRYSGGYVDDQRHGPGIYTWPDGRQVAGHWHRDQPPQVLSPAMQVTVRAHAERLVALSQPGTRVCREVQLGVAQRDIVTGVVQDTEGQRVRILIERTGSFSKQLDGRVIAAGDKVLVYPDGWFACR